MKRDYETESKVKASWYVSHILGYLVSYAALKGLPCLKRAIARLAEDVEARVVETDFRERVMKKAIKLGRRIGKGEADA